MKHTSKYGFKLPESTDIYNVEDINDNTRSIEEKLSEIEDVAGNALQSDDDTQDNTVSFTSSDSTSPTGWTNVSLISSGDTHRNIFEKISVMFKNIRWLYKILGTSDISKIGSGTVTSAILSIFNDKISCSDGTQSGKNGKYFKFSNGLLICVHTIYVETAIKTPWGLMYESGQLNLGSWSHDFVTTPYVSLASKASGSYGVGVNSIIQGLWDTSAKSIGITQLMRPTSTDSSVYYIDVIGIGFWK